MILLERSVTRNDHVQYESSNINILEVMTNVNFNTHVNYKSSGTYNLNVINKVKVFKSRPDSKVKVKRSKLLVSLERIC